MIKSESKWKDVLLVMLIYRRNMQDNDNLKKKTLHENQMYFTAYGISSFISFNNYFVEFHIRKLAFLRVFVFLLKNLMANK